MIDLRPDLPPIRDQGRRATCVAFAGTANHEWLRRDGETLSVEFLHWAAKARDGLAAGTSGTTLRAATRALADIGQPPEPSWPYDDSRDDRAPAYGPPAGACEAAQQRRLSSCVLLSAGFWRPPRCPRRPGPRAEGRQGLA